MDFLPLLVSDIEDALDQNVKVQVKSVMMC